MANSLKANPSLNDWAVKANRLVFRFSITANATPASKTHTVDIPVVHLRTQGKTAEVDALETLTWTSAVDATNAIFGVYVDLGGKASSVKKVTVTEITALETSHTTKGPNAVVDSFLTAGGNVAIELSATGLDLVSESPTYVVEIEYQQK
jgi:Tfp pilus assembly protein PilV